MGTVGSVRGNVVGAMALRGLRSWIACVLDSESRRLSAWAARLNVAFRINPLMPHAALCRARSRIAVLGTVESSRTRHNQEVAGR